MDPRKSASKNFVDVALQFVETLAEAWPNEFSEYRLKLRTRSRTLESDCKLVEDFHDKYKHLFDKTTLKDPSLFDDELLQQYKAREKYDASNQDTINVAWQYIEHMVRFATMYKMYDGIPSNVMNVISNSIDDVKSKLDSGTLDPKYLNPLELGQDVMSKINPADIQEMTQTLLGNEKSMQNMLNTLQILMTGMNSGAVGPNIMSLLQNPEDLLRNVDISKMIAGMPSGPSGP